MVRLRKASLAFVGFDFMLPRNCTQADDRRMERDASQEMLQLLSKVRTFLLSRWFPSFHDPRPSVIV